MKKTIANSHGNNCKNEIPDAPKKTKPKPKNQIYVKKRIRVR